VWFIAEQGVLRVISRLESAPQLIHGAGDALSKPLAARAPAETHGGERASTRLHQAARKSNVLNLNYFAQESEKIKNEFVLDPTPTDTMKSST